MIKFLTPEQFCDILDNAIPTVLLPNHLFIGYCEEVIADDSTIVRSYYLIVCFTIKVNDCINILDVYSFSEGEQHRKYYKECLEHLLKIGKIFDIPIIARRPVTISHESEKFLLEAGYRETAFYKTYIYDGEGVSNAPAGRSIKG